MDATPEEVWRALVDSALTRQYFLHEHVSDWQPGSRWEHIRSDGSGIVDIYGILLESASPRRLILSWIRTIESDNPSRVTFDISPYGAAACLTIIHEEREIGSEYYNGMAAGWPKILSNLNSLLETGRTLNLDWRALKKAGRWHD